MLDNLLHIYNTYMLDHASSKQLHSVAMKL